MAERNYESFRALLRSAIGNNTQAAFAKRTGISAEHLNRMLNSKTIHRPSQQTLESIAKCALNGVTLQDMINALNFDDPEYHVLTVRDIANEEAKREFAPSFEETANKVFSLVKRSVTKLFDEEKIYGVSDINDFMLKVADNYNFLRKTGSNDIDIDLFYDIEAPRQYFGLIYDDVTHYVTVNLNIAGDYNSADSMLIIYFSYLAKSDDIIIQHADMSMCNIVDLYGFPPVLMQKYGAENADEGEVMDKIRNLPYYICIKTMRQCAPGAEKRLLDFIFGNNDKPENYVPKTIYGFGFDITEVPKNFKDFVLAHKTAILEYCRKSKTAYLKMMQRLQAAESAEDGKVCAEAFNDYTNDVYCEDGWMAVLTGIMRIETGFPFYLYSEETDPKVTSVLPDLSKESVIIIPEDYIISKNISNNTVVSVVGRYAAELGIESFGDIEYHDYDIQEFRKPRVYKVNEQTSEYEPEDDIIWTDFPKNKPSKSDTYNVLFKDGRIMKAVYLQHAAFEDGLWTAFHKSWNHMVKAFEAKD